MKFHRVHAVVAVVSVLLILLFLFGLFLGSVKIPLGKIVAILTGTDRDSAATKIVMGIRLPRIMMAVLVGMMLSTAGTISPAVFRNPLADPYYHRH